jgi:hypothetical protein
MAYSAIGCSRIESTLAPVLETTISARPELNFNAPKTLLAVIDVVRTICVAAVLRTGEGLQTDFVHSAAQEMRFSPAPQIVSVER